MNTIGIKNYQDIKLFKLGSNLLGKPRIFVYSFLIDGILLDTGQPHVEKIFLEALGQEKIEKIILTHHHEDHCGNIKAIKKTKGIEAFGSKLCQSLLQKPKRIEPARLVTWGQNRKADIQQLDIVQPLKTDKYSFEIFESPGHAIDQLSFYEPNQGWLFPGDLFVNDYVKIFMRDEDIYQQILSIQKLMKLDFDVLFCHHQPILKGGKQRLQNKLQFLQDFYGQIKEIYLQGKNAKEIMSTLSLKEEWPIKLFSMGQLSRVNMVRSVLRSPEFQTGVEI